MFLKLAGRNQWLGHVSQGIVLASPLFEQPPCSARMLSLLVQPTFEVKLCGIYASAAEPYERYMVGFRFYRNFVGDLHNCLRGTFIYGGLKRYTKQVFLHDLADRTMIWTFATQNMPGEDAP